MKSFGDIRSLVHSPPSPQVWEQLLDLLCKLRRREYNKVVSPYLEQTLQQWPSVLRVIPDTYWTLLQDASARRALRHAQRASITQHLKSVHPTILQALAQSGLSKTLHHLSVIETRAKPQELHQLLIEEPWPVLETLNLRGNRLDYRQAHALSQSDNFQHLQSLNLSDTALTTSTWTGLTRLLVQPTLETIHLRSNPQLFQQRDHIAQWFLTNPTLAWRACSLSASESGEDVVASWHHTTLPGQLETLAMVDWKLNQRQATVFAKAPWMNLHTLKLGGLATSALAIRHLLDDQTTPALHTLALNSQREDPSWFMTHGDLHDRLKVLDLRSNHAWQETLRTILLAKPWPKLEHLSLRLCDMSTETIADIIQHIDAPKLHTLDVSNNNIDNHVMARLAQSPNLGTLKHLYLSNNRFDSEGLRQLAQSPHLRDMDTLVLSGNAIGRQGVHALNNSEVVSDALKTQLSKLL